MRALLATTLLAILTAFAAVLVGAPLIAGWLCVAGGYAAAQHDSGYGQ